MRSIRVVPEFAAFLLILVLMQGRQAGETSMFETKWGSSGPGSYPSRLFTSNMVGCTATTIRWTNTVT